MTYRAMRGGAVLESTCAEEMLRFLHGIRPSNQIAPPAPRRPPMSPAAAARFAQHRALATVLARSAKRRFKAIDIADIDAFALEGLWDAAVRFDERRGVPFRSYATIRISGEINEQIRALQMLPRRHHGRGASMVELTGEAIVGDATQDDDVDAVRSFEAIRSKVDSLDAEERALIVGHYFQDRRFDHVAADLGISKSWASRVHSRAIRKLRKRVAAAQVAP